MASAAVPAFVSLILLSPSPAPATEASRQEEAPRAAAENGVRVEEIFRRTRRMMQAWLAYADERTRLLPDFLPGYARGRGPLDLYTPHNSGADNYPYLVATAFFTDRAIYEGRMREMLRNEILYTAAPDGIPGELDLRTGRLGPPSLFGAAEYAKDGLVAVTELLGRTPWFYRMADMTAALMQRAAVPSAFGALPDAGAELNGAVKLGAVREGDRLFVSLEAPPGYRDRLHFDHARHRRVLNFARDYVRLNEWPEWFTVDENRLYRLVDGQGREIVRTGAELKEGIDVAAPGRWTVEAWRP